MACLARCVCFVCVPRLSLVGFGGLSAGRGGEGAGGERVGAERGERGRGGRAASRLSGFKTEVGGKKKKNLSEDLARSHSLPPSLAHAVALRAAVPESRSSRRKRRTGDCPGAKSRAAHSQPFRKAIAIGRTSRAEAPVAGAPGGPGRPGRRPAARGVAGALPGSGGISIKVVRVGRCAASSWRWAAAAARLRRMEAARRSLRAAGAAGAAAEAAGSGPEPPGLAPPPPLKPLLPLLPPPEPLLLPLPPPPHTHRERVNSPAAREKR